MPTMNVDQKKQLETDIEWTRNNLSSLERDRSRMPWLFGLALFAIPVGIRWGILAAVLTALGTAFLTAAGLYIIAGHRSEYEAKLRSLEEELARVLGAKPK